MALFRSRQSDPASSDGILGEIERLLRRLRVLPLVAPALLLVGFGFGEVAKATLKLPDGTATRIRAEREIPRVRLEALSTRLRSIRASGQETVDYVALYREHVEPVEAVLQRRGVPRKTARQISWPLVEESYAKGLDPATVVAILIMESGGKPTAKSPVGARGLMQVMPAWAGRWRGCGKDLMDIQDNLCNGTSILRWYLQQHGTERQALLGYNGCVRGTNTPNCFTYPDKVWRLREQIKGELTRERARFFDNLADN